MPSFAPGNRSRTASAMTCAVEWRIASRSLCAPASSSSSAEPRSGASRISSLRRRRRPRPPARLLGCVARLLAHALADLRRIRKTSRPPQDERSCLPRFHPPSRRRGPADDAGAPARSCRANGRIPGRFTGRSRVVLAGRLDRRAFSRCRGSLGVLWPGRASRSTRSLLASMVGDTGLEPVTSCMSSKCSNQLS